MDNPTDDRRGSEFAGQTGGGSRQPPEFPGRRSFLLVLMGLGSAIVGALLAVPLIVYATDPLFRKTSRQPWSKVAPISKFDNLSEPAEPVISLVRTDGWRVITSEKPVYVLPPGVGQHGVLSPVCPHLGCDVEWRDADKHFCCPCHNSIFAEDGHVLSGPAPRPMDYLDSKVEDGQLMVRYQYFRELVADREVME